VNDLILFIAVGCLTASQVLQKLGAQRRLSETKSARQWIAALLAPELIGAALTIAIGTLLWLYVLYEMDVSRAFPFLSLGSVAVVAVSRIFLGEHVSLYRWVGVLLITVGLTLVAQS